MARPAEYLCVLPGVLAAVMSPHNTVYLKRPEHARSATQKALGAVMLEQLPL